LYKDDVPNPDPFTTATLAGARIFRVRYINPLQGDYDIDGDVDTDDYTRSKSTFGSNLLLAADGNGNGVVDAADYTIWRDNFGASLPGAAAAVEAASQALVSTEQLSELAESPVAITSLEPSDVAADNTNDVIGLALASFFTDDEAAPASSAVASEFAPAMSTDNDLLLALVAAINPTRSESNALAISGDGSSPEGVTESVDVLFGELELELVDWV
jgi:hypothetical protein